MAEACGPEQRYQPPGRSWCVLLTSTQWLMSMAPPDTLATLGALDLGSAEPWEPIPPKFGGVQIHPPKFEGWIFKNHLFYSVSGRSLPKFGGWNLRPPNLGGVGFQGRGSPRFVPISPFSSDLFQIALLVFGNSLSFPFLGWSSLFFPLRRIPCFLSVLPFFSRDFRGSVEIKILVFWAGFLEIKKNMERKDKSRTHPQNNIASLVFCRRSFGTQSGTEKGKNFLYFQNHSLEPSSHRSTSTRKACYFACPLCVRTDAAQPQSLAFRIADVIARTFRS